MEQFWVLLGQIFVIVIVQMVFEKLMGDKVSWAPQVVAVICYCASLYLVVLFILENFLGELQTVFSGMGLTMNHVFFPAFL